MIGKKLREIRTEKGYGVRELARLAGVSPSIITTAEQGKHRTSLENVVKLCGVLGVKVDDLLEED